MVFQIFFLLVSFPSVRFLTTQPILLCNWLIIIVAITIAPPPNDLGSASFYFIPLIKKLLCLPFQSTYCTPHHKQFVCGQFTDIPFTLHHTVFLFLFHLQDQAVFFGCLTLRTEAPCSPKSQVTIYQWTRFKPQKIQISSLSPSSSL